MKNSYRTRILYLIISVSVFFSCKQRHQPTQNQNEIVVFSPGAVIPSYQDKLLNTYQVSEKSAMNESMVINYLKQVLSLMGEESNFELTNKTQEGDRWFFLNKNDPSASCIVNVKTGDIQVNSGTKNYMTSASTQDLLKKDEAVKIAQRYLQELKYIDLNDKSLVEGHVGGINMGVHDEKNESQVYEKFTTVRYDRKFDSIPVLGHSRFILQLAEKGKLHSIIRQWPIYNETKISKDEEVVPDEAKRAIVQHLMNENKNAKKITVNQVNLVYYESKGMIEPALHVICQIQLPKSKSDTTLMTFPYDLVEPIMKRPRMIYTFMAEPHRDQPAQSDKVDTAQAPKAGDDERKQQ